MNRRPADPFRRELEDFDGEYSESWIPKPGDVLVGELLRYTTGTTEYGQCPIAVIRDEDGGEERSVWLLHAVLRREFQEQRPRPGERLGIKRLPDDRKRRYKRYALRVDRDEPVVPDLDRYPPAGDVAPEHVDEAVRSSREHGRDPEPSAPFGADDDDPF